MIGAADIHVEKHGVAIAILALDQVIEIRSHVFEGLGQAGLYFTASTAKLNGGDAGIGQAVDDVRAAAGGALVANVNPKAFLRRVVDTLCTKSGRSSGSPPISASTRQAVSCSQSMDAHGDVLGHALDADCRRPSNSGNRDCISTR